MRLRKGYSMLKCIIAAFFMLITHQHILYAQIGGQRSFEFMTLPHAARTVALGGMNVSLAGEDVNLALNNPSLASDTLSGHASFNYLSYFADVHNLSVVYQYGPNRPWFVGVHHINYGELEGFDGSGASLGKYNAGETEVVIGRSHTIRFFSLGASMKFVHSNIAGYSSNAVAFDIGGVFRHPEQNLSVGLVFKNIGFVLSEYSQTSSSRLPFDIRAGISFKPEHMPFRFSFTGHHLFKSDITYFNPADHTEEPGKFDRIFRHIVIGTELLLTKNVNLRVGYNHLVRQELRLENRAGGAGFSCGVMFRVHAFEFAYSRGGYHTAGGSHSFMLTANTQLFFKKGKL